MKHNIITTENYLLVVDDSEIKVGDWYPLYCEISNKINSVDRWDGKTQLMAKTIQLKIIAHLPLNGSPTLESVDLLPPFSCRRENGVEELAEEYASKASEIDAPYANGLFYGFTAGYNKAKEKYKYTEEDIINAILFGMQKGLNVGKVDETDCDWVNNYVKSLQQPKMPVGFECETVTRIYDVYPQRTEYKPKTTTNSQGLTQWVGNYI